MNLREELNTHHEKTWVLCLSHPPKGEAQVLTPLPDLVYWYNNQLLTKSLLSKKINLAFGELTLMPTGGLLSAEKLLVVGMGPTESLTVPVARKFLQDLSQTLKSLQAEPAWLIFSSHIPAKFIDEIKKQVPVSVG